MVMIFKIKASTRNLCIVCSVTAPKSYRLYVYFYIDNLNSNYL